MQDDKLLPCPFCGENSAGVSNNQLYLNMWQVQCNNCCCITTNGATSEEAHEHWNTRHNPVQDALEIAIAEASERLKRSGYATIANNLEAALAMVKG